MRIVKLVLRKSWPKLGGKRAAQGLEPLCRLG